MKELFISSVMSPATFLETLIQLNASLEPPKTQPELINVYMDKLNAISSNQLFLDFVKNRIHRGRLAKGMHVEKLKRHGAMVTESLHSPPRNATRVLRTRIYPP